jgi:hypothetical protein
MRENESLFNFFVSVYPGWGKMRKNLQLLICSAERPVSAEHVKIFRPVFMLLQFARHALISEQGKQEL